LLVAVAALAALALGGAVFAQAQSSPPPAPRSPSAAPERTTAPDKDNVQSGDQSTPDARTASATPGGESPENSAESESATANDGPGGHADEPANAAADHQFQGNE
jgi:hypothetical protein